MPDKAEADTKEEKTEDHDGRSDISTGNIPAIEELPDSLEKTLDNKQSIICHRESPLYTNGRASRTAITNLMMT